MKLRAFTLVEILITILILAILSSTGIVLWDGAVDSARQRICAQNQYILDESLKMYIYEKEAVPLSLSSIVPEYSEIVIAKVSRENLLFKPARQISLALIRVDEGKQAWASSSFSEYLMSNKTILRCPAKKGTGLSYGYNTALDTPNPIAAYRTLKANNMPIICDSDNETFSAPGGIISGAAFRHRRIGRQPIAIAFGNKGAVQIPQGNTDYTAVSPIPGHAKASDQARQVTSR